MKIPKRSESNGKKKIEMYLFGMMKTLEVVFSKKYTVLGLPASRHTLTEIHPEIIASSFIPCNSPSRRHWSKLFLLPLLWKLVNCDQNRMLRAIADRSTFGPRPNNIFYQFRPKCLFFTRLDRPVKNK